MKLLLIAVIIHLSLLSTAQVNSDSLLTVWKNTNESDSNRLISLFGYYQSVHMYTNADSAMVYAKMHYDFAKEIRNKGFIAGGLNSIGQCYMTTGQSDSALYYFSQSIEIFFEAGDTIGAAGSIINSGILLSDLGRNDEAITKYQLGIELCDAIGEVPFKLNALNNLAVLHLNQGSLDNAIPIFKEIIELASKNEKSLDVQQGALVNLGFALAKKGDHAAAIDNYNKAIHLLDKNRGGQAEIYAYNFLGNSYSTLGEIENALDAYSKSYALSDTLGDPANMAVSLSNIAGINQDRGDFVKARKMYEKALELMVESDHLVGALQPMNRLAILDLEEGNVSEAETRFNEILKTANEFGEDDEKGAALLGLGKVANKRKAYTKAIEHLNEARKIGLVLGDIYLIQEAAEEISFSYKATGKSKLALQMFEEAILYRDSVQRDENKRAAIRQEFRYAYDKQAISDSLEFAKKEAIKDLEIDKRDANLAKQRIGLFAAGGGLILLVLLAYSIRRGKKRSDELLHNILPKEVATELKEKGKVGSKRFDLVTVLFTDFKGFTAMSEKVSPKELVNDLNICFSEFDQITSKYGIEKIKTIGDAYMAAGGLPTPSVDHAKNVALAAMEMAAFVQEGKLRKIDQGLPYFEVRIGIHTGPVVAGIVGVKKFQYDIWGDTVNTASRMESSGEVGKVNISQAAYELLKDDPQFAFENRGKIEAKGKGEMEMWFVSKAKDPINIEPSDV